MGVYIKGMEMPKSCAECALNYDCFKCIVTGTPFFDHEHHFFFDDEMTRLDNCPLSPVPPHGDLIDRDALPTNRVEWEDIVNAPTIIEADMDSFIRIFEEDDEEDGMDSFIRILKD